MESFKKIAVIGGGAAGMMAAGTATLYGAKVTVFEQTDRLGKKLAITGKGRCNVTNNTSINEFLENVTKNERFLYAPLNSLDPESTMIFFEGLGVQLKTERGRRVFPVSEKAKDIVDELNNMKKNLHSSFIINKLDFLHAGGRCSTVAALGANLLKLKPCIEVDNNDASMHVGKKYRGDLKSTLVKYISEKLSSYDNIDTKRIFIAYTEIDDETLLEIKEEILKNVKFEEIYTSQASCTISCHCGPGTLGILFMTK